MLNSSPILGDKPLLKLPSEHPLSQAYAAARAASHERLAALIDERIDPDAMSTESIERAVISRIKDDAFVETLRPWRLVEAAVQQWMRTDYEAPVGMTLSAGGKRDPMDDVWPSPLGHDPLPQRSVGRLATLVDRGFVLGVHGVGDRHAPLQRFLEDLERVLDMVVVTTLHLGVRTALGAIPQRSPYGRLLLQLSGQRHIGVVKDADDRGHVTVGRGSLVYVPPTWLARHEPTDQDSLHLELILTRPRAVAGEYDADGGFIDRDPDADEELTLEEQELQVPEEFQAAWRAWVPPRGIHAFAPALRALVHGAWGDFTVRLPLPGGILQAGESDEGRYAAGGFEFSLTEDQVPHVARLLEADGLPGDELPPDLLEGLLDAGVLIVEV